MSETIPFDHLPMLTWPKFLYKQQREFLGSGCWQTWFVAANGTGKSLIIYLTSVLHMKGVHPLYLGDPPVKIKALVPSFDMLLTWRWRSCLRGRRLCFGTTL